MGRILIGGHICLDIFLNFNADWPEFLKNFTPGSQIKTENSIFSPGGPVSNTGISLGKLGTPTILLSKTGPDELGTLLREKLGTILADFDVELCVQPAFNSETSHTIIINSSEFDRIFLHTTGYNDLMKANDLIYSGKSEISLFHFGYPPIMASMIDDNGSELKKLFKYYNNLGIITSLDTCMPGSLKLEIIWKDIFANVSPLVDIIMPGVRELILMMNPSRYSRMLDLTDFNQGINKSLLDTLANDMINMGIAIVVLKLGENGLYLKTSPKIESFSKISKSSGINPEFWVGREILMPSFNVRNVGTTGAGDAATAGFLSDFMNGKNPEEVLEFACAVAAFSVEQTDSVSGISSKENTLERINSGWIKKIPSLNMRGLLPQKNGRCFYGESDKLFGSKK